MRDVTLDIHAGELVGMLGPNGAGKSTLLSMLQGLRRPCSGSVQIFGQNPRDVAARRALGCTPQETALPDTLRVREVIDYVGGHFRERISTTELAGQFGLTDILKRQCGSLSGGQKRRVSVALAFVGCPALVLLDEPTTGLDIDARRSLWDAIRRQHDAGTTIVITSHYLEEIEALAERVIVLDDRAVLVDDTLERVRGIVGVRRVTLNTADASAIIALPGITHHESASNGELTLMSPDADAFVRALVASGHPFHDLTVRGATLEEAFLSLTTDRIAA